MRIMHCLILCECPHLVLIFYHHLLLSLLPLIQADSPPPPQRFLAFVHPLGLPSSDLTRYTVRPSAPPPTSSKSPWSTSVVDKLHQLRAADAEATAGTTASGIKRAGTYSPCWAKHPSPDTRKKFLPVLQSNLLHFQHVNKQRSKASP